MKKSWEREIPGNIETEDEEERKKDVENKWTEKARVQSCIDAASKGYDKHYG